MSRTLALLPLRGGSKGIHKKNIRPIAGRPLCYWALKAAVDSLLFETIVVSTEDPEIKHHIQDFKFPNVEILDRPRDLAQDETSTEEVIAHFAKHYQFEYLVTIQATSPLTQPQDFQNALDQFKAEKADSLLTGVPIKRFFWDPTGIPLNYDPTHRPRRQDFNGTLMENGAFYITSHTIWTRFQNRLGGKMSIYKMSEDHATELDDPKDWPIIEKILKQRHPTIPNIRMLILDVDGVLTDGSMFYTESGDELKKFNTRDGKAIELLQKKGIKTAIITAEKVQLVQRRAQKLNIDHVILGSQNKLKDALTLCKQEGLTLHQCAFIGDDIQDIELLEHVGFAACPQDANRQVLALPNITIIPTKGGEGVVRNYVDDFLFITS